MWSWLLVVGSLVAQGAESVWLEGEDAVESTFNNHSWYCCSDVRKDLLSPGSPDQPDTPGEWLSHYSYGGSEASASYELTLAEGGSYDVWVRTACYPNVMTLSVDGATPLAVDTDYGCRESFNMNWPGIDIRFMGWVKVPGVSIEAGTRTLTWAFSHHANISGDQVHGGIDAFLVTNEAWGPAGAMRPDQMPQSYSATDWTVWAPGDPPQDPADSVFDLSRLIQAPAGEHGALQRDGADFAFADDTPVKFWGMGSNYPGTVELAQQQARMYRMFGINMVRLHPVQGMLGLLDESGNLDAEQLDKLRMVGDGSAN